MRCFASLAASLILCLSVGLISCGSPSVVTRKATRDYDYNVVTTEPGFQLKASEFYDLLYFSQIEPGGGVVEPAVARDFLDSIVIDTLAGYVANDFNLRDNWSQHRVYMNQMNGFLTKLFWETMLPGGGEVDSQKVADFYALYSENYFAPEQVDLYQIFCSPSVYRLASDTANIDEFISSEEAWVKAGEGAWILHGMLGDSVDFRDVARNYSDDVLSREGGGYVGWTVRGKYPEPFDSIAFSLQPGEYSEPYKDVDGWHIILVAGHQEEGTLPMESPIVYRAAVTAIQKEKNNLRGRAIMDSLRGEINLEINDAVLDTLIYFVEDSTWAGVVNGIDTIDARRLKGLEEGYRRRYGVDNTLPEHRREMIQQVALRYAVIQAARAKGLDKLGNYVQASIDLRHGKSKALVLENRFGTTWKADDSVVEKYFNEHIDQYIPPKPLTLRQLIVTDSALGIFLIEQARTGIYLEDLKKEYGDAQGYDVVYEDLGNVGKGDIDERIYKAAMRPTGALGALAHTEKGYHVIKVVKRLRSTPLSMARGSIGALMREQHRREVWTEFRDNLYAKFGVRFPKSLKALRVPKLAVRYEHKP